VRSTGPLVGPARLVGLNRKGEGVQERWWVGRASTRVLLGRGEEKGKSARVADFVFLFQKCEIVIVFVYFSKIFVKLQKY
jgi:hypothetical protein